MPKNKGWFRFYDRAIDNPKIRGLSSESFRLLTSLWCLASSSGKGNGETGHTQAQVKRRFFWLHSSGNKFKKWWQELCNVGLILEKAMENGDKSNEEAHIKHKESNEEVKKMVIIPNWNEHQYDYRSKVPKYRKERGWDNPEQEKQRANVKLTGSQREANVKVDTETDTETDTEKNKDYAVSDKKPIAQPLPPKSLKIETDWIPQDAWHGFVEMRKKIKAPLTPYAIKLAVTKLDELRKNGHAPEAVLNQSTLNGWKSLYPLKDNTRASPARLERQGNTDWEAHEKELKRQQGIGV